MRSPGDAANVLRRPHGQSSTPCPGHLFDPGRASERVPEPGLVEQGRKTYQVPVQAGLARNAPIDPQLIKLAGKCRASVLLSDVWRDGRQY